MGCDIHMHVEYKTDNGWCCGDYFELDRRSTIDNPRYYYIDLYDNRNYALFSVLANVRNYADTEYIDEPRGLPDDVTDFVKEDYDSECWDVHSCSYFTLKELIDFHKQAKPLKRTGLLSPSQLDALDNHGILPTSWCQGCNIAGYERRKWEEENTVLVPLIERLIKRADELHLFYNFQFDENFEGRGYELSDEIRIVFWFDN